MEWRSFTGEASRWRIKESALNKLLPWEFFLLIFFCGFFKGIVLLDNINVNYKQRKNSTKWSWFPTRIQITTCRTALLVLAGLKQSQYKIRHFSLVFESNLWANIPSFPPRGQKHTQISIFSLRPFCFPHPLSFMMENIYFYDWYQCAWHFCDIFNLCLSKSFSRVAMRHLTI